MNGMALIVTGAVLLGIGALVGVYSLIFEMTKARKIKKELEEEYL